MAREDGGRFFKHLNLENGMKKRVLFALFAVTVFVILFAGFVVSETDTHAVKIAKAFSCLDTRVNSTELSLE